jgi:hypothetical protein
MFNNKRGPRFKVGLQGLARVGGKLISIKMIDVSSEGFRFRIEENSTPIQPGQTIEVFANIGPETFVKSSGEIRWEKKGFLYGAKIVTQNKKWREWIEVCDKPTRSASIDPQKLTA